jgi:hypothetical protein
MIIDKDENELKKVDKIHFHLVLFRIQIYVDSYN